MEDSRTFWNLISMTHFSVLNTALSRDMIMVYILHATVLFLQEIQLEDLQIAVCAIESFLTTKVASLDPDFIAQTDLVSQ